MIYDITQELFESVVYPGDTAPQAITVRDMKKGDAVNLTDIKMCAHNGTHLDAPLHFLRDGKDIASLELDRCIGDAEVVAFNNLERILTTDSDRILLKGCESMEESLAERLVQKKLKLVGVEGQSVGDHAVHRLLLSYNIVVLEGIRLGDVPEGRYTLFAAPLKLKNCEGSPCRAVLMD